MMNSRNILSLITAVGLSLTAAGVMAVPLNGAGPANASDADVTQRVSLGFAAAPVHAAVPGALEAAAGRVAKGDFFERPGCFGQVWPEISAECLSKVAGLTSLPARTVTIGYQIGDATTVLVRMPAPQVASR
jgi:hypothetical protein